ncbi:MAG: peptide-binding protein [Candidatus Latescibacterota bacterium]|nr:MAG: peptide-binding protein [Candidatus Latescibacterota bacterium]
MEISKRVLASVLLVGVAISVIAACGKRQAEPRPGGTVVIGLLSDPETLNPLVATSIESKDIIDLLFLKLVDEQSDFLNFDPSLAERWEFSEDSLSITFFVRQDLLWEDGEPVDAEDVRFTWELQIDTLVAWTGRSLKDRIEDVEVVDEHTVRFHFANRYPYQLMDANDGVILPKHIVEKIPREKFRTSEFGRQPVGNGPFKLTRWVSDQHIELERNPLYYEEGRPVLDRVVYRVVPDMTTLITQLKTGEIDCLESIPVDALTDIRESYPDIKIYSYLSRAQTFIAWNLDDPLFAEREIRRALAMSINTTEIIQTLWGGMAEPGDSPMHPILWAHDPSMKPIDFDPEEARQIFEKHGWIDSDGDGFIEKNGSRFDFEMTTNQGVQLRADIATMCQEYLRRVGIKVNPRIMEFNTFIQGVLDGEFQSCVLGWEVGTRVDLTRYWKSTSKPPSGYNISGFNHPEADSLIDRAKNTLDPSEARPLWYRWQQIVYDEQPILFLAVPYKVVGLKKRFCGVEPNAIGFFVNLPEWYVSDDCR